MKLNTKKFSLRLQELMKEKGLTIYSLGAVVNLSASAISRYTNSKMMPKWTTVEILAKYFNVNSNWLMGSNDNRSTYTTNEKLRNFQEKHLVLSSEQVTLLIDCVNILQAQSKLLVGESNIQLEEVEKILKEYNE